MSTTVPSGSAAEDALRAQVARLAEDKANLQLVLRLIEALSPGMGLDGLVQGLLSAIIETIGGTDAHLWFQLDQETRHCSFLGGTQRVDAIDDPLAVEAIASRGLVEQRQGDTDALLLQVGAVHAWTWAFPLFAGPHVLGAVKLENLHLSSDRLRLHLPAFFAHVALLLSHEIRQEQRARLEAAYRSAEARLYHVLEVAPIAVGWSDHTGAVRYVNRRFTDLFGYAKAEIPTLDRWFERAYPDPAYRREVSEAWSRAVRDAIHGAGDVPRLETRITCADQQVRHVEIAGTLIDNGLVASFTDLTERLRTEQDLRLAASVFDNSQEGVMITDAQNRILRVNPAFTEITGFPAEDVVGQDPKILASKRHSPEFYANLWASLRDTGQWKGEIVNRRKSGGVYTEILSIDAVRDKTGAVQHYVGAFTDITPLKAHEAELERIANYDTLTGLPNRRLLLDRLRHERAKAIRSGRSMAVCFLDLDGFKPINDQYGHQAGDQVLVEVSQRLRSASRAGDTVSRLGGDEFVVLLCDLQHEREAGPAIERVLQSIGRPIQIDGHDVALSASIGVTLFPRDDADTDALLRHADLAMYQAKEGGKGRIRHFDADRDRVLRHHRDTLQRLQRALEQREFVLHYQPQVDLVDGTLIGLEALIRWQDPERGLRAPGDFLPLILGSDLEEPLGEWVIDTALSQSAAWAAAGLTPTVSVNVGAGHLLRPTFGERLRYLLSRHPDVPPDRLELEVVESTAINDLSDAARTLADCASLGVRLSLDDFGTGYSSLTYFHKLPAGKLKVDQSFIQGMSESPDDLGLVESVISLSRAFNHGLIAEGIEADEQARILLSLGCREGQGYLLARPMPAARVPEWAVEWAAQAPWRRWATLTLTPLQVGLRVADRAHRRWVHDTLAWIEGRSAAPPQLHPERCPFGLWAQRRRADLVAAWHGWGAVEQAHLALHATVYELAAARGADAAFKEPLFDAVHRQSAALSAACGPEDDPTQAPSRCPA